MGASEGSAAEEASGLRDLLSKGIKNFLDPAHRGAFASHGVDAEQDNSVDGGSLSSSETLSETSLVAHELGRLEADGGVTTLRRRIDELTELSVSLEKHLSVRTESRYRELMEASKSLIEASSMRQLCEHYFPNLQSAFDSYTRSSLYNVLSLPRMNARKTALTNLLGILEHIRTLGCYRDIVRCYAYCTRHRIVAAAVAIHDIDSFISRDDAGSRLIVLRSLRDSFSNRIQILIRNCAFKLDPGLNFCASVQLFHLLGISLESTALHVLCGHRRHLFGILLSTLQRYANLDSSSFPPDESHVDVYVEGAKARPQPPSKSLLSDLISCTRLLGPNMILLSLCKVLSEFTSYLETVASELERESSGVRFGSTAFPEALSDIEPYIRDLDDRDVGAYLDGVLAIVRRDFNSLRAYVCGLLATVMSEVSISGVKDRNDYLKIALLLRFFVLSQTECIKPLENDVAVTTSEGDDSESTCIVEDDLGVVYMDDFAIEEVRSILHSYGDVLLSAVPKDDISYNHDPSHHLAKLEELIYLRLLVPYTEHFYQETLEKLSMTLEGDPCERLAAPAGAIYERCDVFQLSVLLTSRIRENMRCYGGLRICTLNP